MMDDGLLTAACDNRKAFTFGAVAFIFLDLFFSQKVFCYFLHIHLGLVVWTPFINNPLHISRSPSFVGLGWWFGFLASLLWMGLFLRGTPRIPNQRASNHRFTISWFFGLTQKEDSFQYFAFIVGASILSGWNLVRFLRFVIILWTLLVNSSVIIQ